MEFSRIEQVFSNVFLNALGNECLLGSLVECRCGVSVQIAHNTYLLKPLDSLKGSQSSLMAAHH